MSDETPDPSPLEPRLPSGRPRPTPRGYDDVPILSDEEVERRVGVRGGGAPRAPIERGPRTPRATRRTEKTTARDALLLVGLVVVGLVALRVFLPDGPLTATATPTPGASEAAVVTLPSVAPPTLGATPGLQTLVPPPTGTAGPPTGVPTTVSTAQPTTAAPTPTLKPGQTPKPTPKVTAVPTHTPVPTLVPTPSPTLNTRATVIVEMVVVKDSGGSSAAVPSNWTIHLAIEGGLTASPNNFAGDSGGTSVSIPAGKGFSVTSNNARSDFAASPSDPDCSKAFGGGGLAAGTTVTCTITRDDKPRVNVTVDVNGGGPSTSADVTVTVTGGLASPSSFTGSGTTVLGAGVAYSINASALTDYTSSGPVGAGCDGSLPLGGSSPATCTFTYDYMPPPPAPAAPFPFLLLPLLRPRRWRTTTTG